MSDRPEHEDGRVPTTRPAGGVKVISTGPAAADGPEFVAVSTIDPDCPGVIVGVVALIDTSATAAPIVTVVGTMALFTGSGSLDVDST